MQRHILQRLRKAYDEETVPPLCLWDARALGIGFSASEMSSFRRAARRLVEDGTLEARYAVDELRPLSGSTYYRIRRGLRPRHGASSFAQGRRSRLVVRLTPTEEDRAAYEQGQATMKGFLGNFGPFALKYDHWWFDVPIGVYHDDEWDPQFKFSGVVDDVNEESAAEVAAENPGRK
jgi:hypothetical protein